MSYRRGNRGFQSGPNQFTEYGPSRRGRRGSGTTSCGDALCLTFVGFAMIIGSIIVQFTTEQNYISRLHDINTIQKTVINMNNYNFFKSIKPSDPVYITDTLHLSSDSQPPIDHDSGVTYKTFVMNKDIEMYQWIEKKSKTKQKSYDGEEERTVTTYDYHKKWDTKYHSNSRFKYPENHYNPQNNQFMNSQNKNKYFWSSKIMLGKYYISQQIRSMLTDNGLTWSDLTQNAYDKYYFAKRGWNMKHGYIYYEYNNKGYQDTEYGEPNVGDVRVRWTGLDLDGYAASFLGSLINSKQLNRYISKNREEYVYLKVGQEDSIEDVIDSFHADNASNLLMFRCLTLVFMCVGFVCMNSLVTYIVSWIPICGNVIGCTLNLVACIIGFVFWILFFIIAYVSARKEVAIGLIVVILLGLFFMQKSAVKKENTEGETKTDLIYSDYVMNVENNQIEDTFDKYSMWRK
eukprot:127628_1